jgi:uncharacterized protein YjiS (DUF1127 family)
MTTYELHDIAAEPRLPNLFAGLGSLFGRVARHHRRYRTLRSIAHLDAIQLRDIGLDPDDVADALNGDGAALWSKIPRLR